MAESTSATTLRAATSTRGNGSESQMVRLDPSSTLQNTVIVISFAHGINTVTNGFSVSIDYIRNGTTLPIDQQTGIERYLDKLTLEPT
jgi:hypothetical protein